MNNFNDLRYKIDVDNHVITKLFYQWEFSMRKKFSTIGNSVGLILDKSILELHGFDRDGDVEITPAPDGGLLIRPAAPESRHASDEEVKAASAKVKARFGKTFKSLA